MSSLKRLALGTLVALGVAAAQAVEPAPSLEEVLVVSDRLSKIDIPLREWPYSISVVNSATMELQNVTNLAQALRYTPGVISEPFGFEPRLTFLRIRGFDASETGLFRDGVRLSNPGFVVSYNLEPYGAERLEVPRGPASVLYGQINPGGLIDYVSKQPRAEAFGEVELEVGSHSYRQLKLDTGGALDDDGRLLYRLTALTRDSETQVDFIDNDRHYVAPALTWLISDATQLTLLAHWQQDDTRSSQALPARGTLFDNPNGDIPVDRFTGEPAVDRYERDEYALGYVLEHDINDDWRFRQNTRYYQIDLDDVSVFSLSVIDDRTIGRALFRNFGELDGFTIDNRLLARLGRHQLFLGLDYRRYDSTSLQFFGGAPSLDIYDPVYGAPVPSPAAPFKDEDAEQRQIGLYIQDQIALGERWVLSLGGRFDSTRNRTQDSAAASRQSQTDDEFVKNVGLVYRSDLGLSPYVSYSESFLSVLGTDSQGRDFEPELGDQIEAGVKYQPDDGGTLVTVAVFDLTRENFTQFDPDTFLPVQTGEVRSKGLELEAAHRFDSGIGLSFSYTVLDVEITESVIPGEKGEQPTQVPERTGSVWASYEVTGGDLAGLGFGVGVRYLGSSFGNTPNTLKSPSETLVDVEAHYDIGALRFALNAQNLLDEEYIASTFERGASQFATFGPTRVVSGSIQYRW